MSNGGKLDYYSVAALGSVGLLSDIAGTVDASYVTDVWGRQVASAGSAVNAFGYAGREFNEDGTYYYRARYYDPRIGRFTSEDPAYYVGGLRQRKRSRTPRLMQCRPAGRPGKGPVRGVSQVL